MVVVLRVRETFFRQSVSVIALRLKLGDGGSSTPLTRAKSALEAIGGGVLLRVEGLPDDGGQFG